MSFHRVKGPLYRAKGQEALKRFICHLTGEEGFDIIFKISMKVVKKPWGKEIWFAYNRKYAGKLLYINRGHRLSLQYHKKKDETMYALKGSYLLEINGKKRKVKEGEVVHFPPKTIHRTTAKYGNVILIEVSSPELNDIVRLSDDYNRIKK